MVNYFQQFLPKLLEQNKLLRKLEKKGVHFTWDAEHHSCFENIKALVSQSMSLASYDRAKPVRVALVQEGKTNTLCK